MWSTDSRFKEYRLVEKYRFPLSISKTVFINERSWSIGASLLSVPSCSPASSGSLTSFHMIEKPMVKIVFIHPKDDIKFES